MNRVPALLIKNNPLTKTSQTVAQAGYVAMSDNYLASRSRGTDIKKSMDGYFITGWQKTFAGIQQMDAILQTIIELEMDFKCKIRWIFLDPKFAGSQGIKCNYHYLNNRIQEELTGENFQLENFSKLQVSRLHCFHLPEILLSALSFLEMNKKTQLQHYFENETAEAYEDGRDLVTESVQEHSAGIRIEWMLRLSDYKNVIKFDKDGRLLKFIDAKFVFTHWGQLLHSECLNTGSHLESYMSLYVFASKCLDLLKAKCNMDKSVPLYHNNLHPSTFIGLFIQAIGIGLYQNNYTYVQYLIKGLQRRNKKANCIGSVINQEEIGIYFPKFTGC